MTMTYLSDVAEETMEPMLFKLEELSDDLKISASQALEDHIQMLYGSIDFVRDYFEAFWLSYYDDQCLQLRDIVDFCESKELNLHWVEPLKWLQSFYIDLSLINVFYYLLYVYIIYFSYMFICDFIT